MPGFSFSLKKKSSWDVALGKVAKAHTEIRERQWLAIKRAALRAETELKKGIKAGAPGGKAFRPLAPLTILLRRRKSSAPLLNSGSMLGSITTTLDKPGLSAFVGVHRTSRSTDGTKLVDVAMIHEYGTKPFTIQVTPGIRRLFFALHRLSGGAIMPLSPRKTIIQHPGVPARPFLRPTFEAIKPKIEAELRTTMMEGGGPLGS